MSLKNTYSSLKRQYHSFCYNRGSNIKYYNFWSDQSPDEMWISRFIKSRKIPLKQRVNITSVLGPVEDMRNSRPGINIFYTGENIHLERFASHKAYLDNHPFDLELGFDYKTAENYLRFPLWVMWHFPADATLLKVDEIVQKMRYPRIGERDKFCSLVCSHDANGIRGQIMDSLEQIAKVDSAGRFRNNTNLLKTIFRDEKSAFLNSYKFNICPENSNCQGYVTEKIFDSLLSGCIPIYWGSDNNPEPDILNQEAVLFWDFESKDLVVQRIKEIFSNPSLYYELANMPRLNESATEIIWDYYCKFETILKLLLK